MGNFLQVIRFGVRSLLRGDRENAEIGVRVALGAQRGNVMKLVVGRGMLLALAGISLGVAGSLVLTPAISSLLFGIGPHDPWTVVLVSVVLGVTAFLACALPAYRATRVDPLVALRYE